MNTLAVISVLAVMLSVVTGLGYNSYSRGYPRGNIWNSWGSRGLGGVNSGGWNMRHHGSYRGKRAAIGYGSHGSNLGRHMGGAFGSRFGGLGSNFGLGSSSGWGSGRQSNGGWNRYGY